MKNNLIHARTYVYNINYHVVWSVKYRRKILNAEIEACLKELVQEIAETIGSVSEENIRRYIEHQSRSY
ncbi:MAG: transposase [Lachnospiraceae bacterium]|nr:transposase [Lachnospiraceae bacterium]